MSGPKGFIVVGETDCLSMSPRSFEMFHDSRLRTVVSGDTSGGTNWRTSYTQRAYSFDQTRRYCEAENLTGSSDLMFGVTDATLADSGTWIASNANSAAMRLTNGANVYVDAAINQSGLGGAAARDVMGMELWIEGGVLNVQFRKNGNPFGSPVSLTLADAYRIGISMSGAGQSATFLCDADELRHLPAGCQPLGAAARVANKLLDTPVGTVLTALAPSGGVTVDAYGRTAIATIAGRSAAPATFRSTGEYLYVGCLVEVFPSTTGFGGVFGLAPASMGLNTNPGNTSGGWGYLGVNGANGTAYFNGAGTNLGSAGRADVGDVMGMLWHVPSGKLWMLKNSTVLLGGDPLALTGEVYSGVFGPLRPVLCPYAGGRQRLLAHAREQPHRPSYAQAWDGADLLPEISCDARISAVPRVNREVSYFLWSNQRQRGETIGQLDLANADGKFDRLADWNLRNQPIIAYTRRADGSIEREWTGLIDSVEHPDTSTCRIEIADATAPLDVHIPSDKLLLGAVSNIPLEPRQGATLIYDVAQTPWVYGELQERGLGAAFGTLNWRFKSSSAGCAIERTSAPNGYQGFVAQKSFYSLGQIALTNGDLSSWSGGAPVGWTVHVAGAGSSVVQNGTAARIKGGATGGAGISQTFAVVAGRYYGLKVTISQYHAGTDNAAPTAYITDSPAGVIRFGSWNGSSTPLQAAKGTGEYFAPFFLAAESGWTSILVACFESNEFSIDSIELHELADLSTMEGATRYLLQQLAESPVDVEWTECPGYPTGGRHGVWYSQRPTIRQAIGNWLTAELADHYTDANGVIQIAWLLPPEEFTSGAHYLGEITEDDLRGPLTVETDSAPGLTDSWGYSENFSKLNDTDIAGTAVAAIRAYLTADRLVAKLAFTGTDPEDAGPFDAFYAHAVNGKPHIGIRDNTQTVLSSLTSNDPNTVTPSNRWNSLIRQHRCYPRAIKRRFFSMEIGREVAMARRLRPGGVLTFKHSRYGLSAGKAMQVWSVESALTEPTVVVRCWG